MKRICIIIALALVSVLSFAQDRIALLDKAVGKRVSFNYVYSYDDGKGLQEVTKGKVIAEGECFMVTGMGLTSYSDGSTCWMVDSKEKEVVIQALSQEDPFTNPALLVNSYRNYMDSIVVKNEGPDSLDIFLLLDNNTKIRFVLSSVKFSDPAGTEEFRFSTSSLSSDYVVTDLR